MNKQLDTPVPLRVVRGFLQAPVCRDMAAFLRQRVKELGGENVESFFSGREISWRTAKDAGEDEIADHMRIVAGKIAARLPQPMYPEYTDLVKWEPGWAMAPHVDNGVEHFRHRKWSSVLYLTDCVGGATYFPAWGLEVTPEVGKCIVYPSGVSHGVRHVVSGLRVTLASWYTDDESKQEE